MDTRDGWTGVRDDPHNIQTGAADGHPWWMDARDGCRSTTDRQAGWMDRHDRRVQRTGRRDEQTPVMDGRARRAYA